MRGSASPGSTGAVPGSNGRRGEHSLGGPLMRIALLAGGTGGAKLAAGAQEPLGSAPSVVAHTADDTRGHGLPASPDPYLSTYRPSRRIDGQTGTGTDA